MRQSELSSVDLLSKYLHLREELSSLATYIDETRQTLGGVKDKLPSASDALTGVTQATEKATHNILGLVEELMERDGELEESLTLVEETVSTAEGRQAVEALRGAADERMAKLTEMMTELSFQDLTCQAIQKISNTILEIEKRLIALIDPIDDDVSSPTAQTRFSGLDRLEENATGASRQDLIDQILSRK